MCEPSQHYFLPEMLKTLVQANDAASINNKNAMYFLDHNIIPNRDSLLAVRMWLKQFRSVTVNCGRRSGHTSCILNSAKAGDLVVLLSKKLKDDFLTRQVNQLATVMSAGNCEMARQRMDPGIEQFIYKKVFVDTASIYSDEQIDQLFEYLKFVSNWNTQVMLIG